MICLNDSLLTMLFKSNNCLMGPTWLSWNPSVVNWTYANLMIWCTHMDYIIHTAFTVVFCLARIVQYFLRIFVITGCRSFFFFFKWICAFLLNCFFLSFFDYVMNLSIWKKLSRINFTSRSIWNYTRSLRA